VAHNFAQKDLIILLLTLHTIIIVLMMVYLREGEVIVEILNQLECGTIPNVMAGLPSIGGANEERKFCNSLPCPTPLG